MRRPTFENTAVKCGPGCGAPRTPVVNGDDAEVKNYSKERTVCYRTQPSDYPATVLLGVYPQDMETYIHADLDMDVYNSFNHNDSNLEATNMSRSRQGNRCCCCVQIMEQ